MVELVGISLSWVCATQDTVSYGIQMFILMTHLAYHVVEWTCWSISWFPCYFVSFIAECFSCVKMG